MYLCDLYGETTKTVINKPLCMCPFCLTFSLLHLILFIHVSSVSLTPYHNYYTPSVYLHFYLSFSHVGYGWETEYSQRVQHGVHRCYHPDMFSHISRKPWKMLWMRLGIGKLHWKPIIWHYINYMTLIINGQWPMVKGQSLFIYYPLLCSI